MNLLYLVENDEGTMKEPDKSEVNGTNDPTPVEDHQGAATPPASHTYSQTRVHAEMILTHQEGGRPAGCVYTREEDTGLNGAMAVELCGSMRARSSHILVRPPPFLDEESVDSIIAGSAPEGFARTTTPTRPLQNSWGTQSHESFKFG